MNIHRGIKPFSCLKCEKTSTQENNLKIHVEKCDSPKFLIKMELVEGNFVKILPQRQNINENEVIEVEKAAKFDQEQSEVITTTFDMVHQDEMKTTKHVNLTSKNKANDFNLRKARKNKCKLQLKTAIPKKTIMKHLLHKDGFDLLLDNNKMLDELDQNSETNSVKDETLTFMEKSSPNCKLCGKMMFNIPSFKLHMNSHSGEKTFACNKCEKRLNGKARLKRHEMESHMDVDTRICGREIKSVECERCKKKLKVDSLKFQGIKCMGDKSDNFYVHSESSIYEGNFKNSYDKWNKIYVECKVCGKMCSFKYTLKYHTFHVHSIEENNKFCSLYGIEFKKLSRLKMQCLKIFQI